MIYYSKPAHLAYNFVITYKCEQKPKIVLFMYKRIIIFDKIKYHI